MYHLSAKRTTLLIAAALTLAGCQGEPSPATSRLILDPMLGQGAAQSNPEAPPRAPCSHLACTINGDGPLMARLLTSAGEIHCRLYEDECPQSVETFIGLATGHLSWLDPTTQITTTRPLYQDLPFHRCVPGLLIQSGDPSGRGNGHPGFYIEDEFHPALLHDRAGTLAMAQHHPNGNGSQFFITARAEPRFNGRFPVFGHCENLDVIQRLATCTGQDDSSAAQAAPHVLFSIDFYRRAAPDHFGASR